MSMLTAAAGHAPRRPAFCIQARRLDETRALLGAAAVTRVEQRLAALHQLELEHAYAQAGHSGLQPGHIGARAGHTWSGCSLDSVGRLQAHCSS